MNRTACAGIKGLRQTQIWNVVYLSSRLWIKGFLTLWAHSVYPRAKPSSYPYCTGGSQNTQAMGEARSK